LLCLFGTSFAYLLLAVSDTLLLLVVAVALAGVAGGTLATAQAYIADSTSPEDRARGLGLIGAAFGLGLIAGPVLGGLLSIFSLSVPAFAASVLALGNVAFGFFVLPESLPVVRRTSTPNLYLNPISQLGGVLRMGGIRTLLLAVFWQTFPSRAC
jgi:MFS family permease